MRERREGVILSLLDGNPAAFHNDSPIPSLTIQLAQVRPLPRLRKKNMKVTEVKVLSADRYNYVKVVTDEGLHGVGELHPASGTGGTPFLPRAGVQYCAEYLVGKDPLQIEKHWQHMFRRCLFRGGADVMSAIGAVDIALWDIKGKAYGRPVYELLGGPEQAAEGSLADVRSPESF